MKRSPATLVKAENLDVCTPLGRQLFQDLNLEFSHDQVAMVGRNGVGKSTLLKILAGETERSEVVLHTTPCFVPQDLGPEMETIGLARKMLSGAELVDAGLSPDVLLQDTCSPGEQRKLQLLAARRTRSDLLILDEPTSDLDEHGVEWLRGWLSEWARGLLLVSHNRSLLRRFQHFFVIAESGCRYLSGDLQTVEDCLETEGLRRQRRYLSDLNALIRREEKNERVNNRHDRKKNRGRINELCRCPSKAKLNEKRSYAQVKQGRRKKLWRKRIAASREWARATRRALDVRLDLKLVAPQQPVDTPTNIVEADCVSAVMDGREIFSKVSMCVRRTDRMVVSGRNGAGKTTLLTMLAGERHANQGRIVGDFSRIGMIEQGAANWKSGIGLIAKLQAVCDATLEDVAAILVSHRFPFGLAQRPLKSLSPGERVRAALICLYHRCPAIELLMLDEPTVGLDFVGLAALRDALTSWPGAMVVVSHDRDFVQSIGVGGEVRLDSVASRHNDAEKGTMPKRGRGSISRMRRF
ncbi:ATP-binding cassette domain-containing protein [Rhodopirellula baltica]